MSAGGKSSTSQTVGYRYSMDLQLGIGRGPVNEMIEIRVGDLVAWKGRSVGNEFITVNQPNLFGGDEKEGGVVGTVGTLFGAATQVVPSIIKTAGGGGLFPEFRGTMTITFSGEISANTPYPKPWKMRVRRWNAGWDDDNPWYPDFAMISMNGDQIAAMNPAHIIYECATNRTWGRGLPAARIDDAAFRLAADQLWNEKFGLCFRWDRQDDIDRFVQTVLNHIGGTVFIDRTTGLLRLNLIRGGYNPADLPAFSYGSGLLDIQDDQSSSGDTVHNEVVVKWHDPITDKDGQIRAQSIASFQALGVVISTTAEYPGIPTFDLAARVAQRDLEMQSNSLRRMTIKLDRRGRIIQPGDAFLISVPTRGIQQMILRAGQITESYLTDGSITIAAVEDVFGLPTTAYITPQPSLWIPPDKTAVVVDTRRIEEVTYFDLARNLTQADLNTVVEDMAEFKALAKQPTGLSINFSIASYAVGEGDTGYAERNIGSWAPCATLSNPGGIGFYDTTITFADIVDAENLVSDGWALIDDEYVRVDDIDPVLGTATIARGCIDTIPAPHDEDARIWFDPGIPATDLRQYTSGETVLVKLLTKTNSETLDIAAAIEDSIDLGGRQGRPYPPGNMTINSIPFGEVFVDSTADLLFEFAHRNRLTEADFLLEHGAGSTATEASVTYTVRVYDPVSLLRTVTGITADNWTYTSVMDALDGNADPIRFEIESERDGFISWFHYDIEFARAPILSTTVGDAYGASTALAFANVLSRGLSAGTSTAAAYGTGGGSIGLAYGTCIVTAAIATAPRGQADGTSTVEGFGTTGLSEGTSTALAIGVGSFIVPGTASGTSTVTAVGTWIISAVGSAAGTSTVTAIPTGGGGFDDDFDADFGT